MVEYKHSVCTSSFENHNELNFQALQFRNSRFFQELLNLLVVSLLDLLIIEKFFLVGSVFVDLKAMAVKCVLILVATDVGNCRDNFFGWSLIECFWSTTRIGQPAIWYDLLELLYPMYVGAGGDPSPGSL